MNQSFNPAGSPVLEITDRSPDPSGTAPDEDRLALPLDGETALRGLLRVDPHAEPADD
jgi:hypothetical protein